MISLSKKNHWHHKDQNYSSLINRGGKGNKAAYYLIQMSSKLVMHAKETKQYFVLEQEIKKKNYITKRSLQVVAIQSILDF